MTAGPRGRGHLVYLDLRARLVALILGGRVREGEALPSVRAIAAASGANPLTVAKAFSMLPPGVIRIEKGVGSFLADGGAERLRAVEQEAFLTEQWPALAAQIRRLGLTPAELHCARDAGAGADLAAAFEAA